MDVMQTKGSRQISRVPSEDAVAPTSGDVNDDDDGGCKKRWVCVSYFCPYETQKKKEAVKERRTLSLLFLSLSIVFCKKKISLRLELLCLRGRIRLFN